MHQIHQIAYLVKLVGAEQLPCPRVGSHRRILFRDVMDFKRRQDEYRLQALDAIAADAQVLGLGY